MYMTWSRALPYLDGMISVSKHNVVIGGSAFFHSSSLTSDFSPEIESSKFVFDDSSQNCQFHQKGSSVDWHKFSKIWTAFFNDRAFCAQGEKRPFRFPHLPNVDIVGAI